MIKNLWNRIKTDWGRRKGVFSNSLFKRTLALQFGIAFIILLSMFFFVNDIVWKNQKEQVSELSSNQLLRGALDMDTQLDNLKNASTKTLTEAIPLLLHSSEPNDITFVYPILDSIKSLEDENNLIAKAVIYQPTTDRIISREDECIGLDGYVEKNVVKKYLSIRKKGRSDKHTATFRVFSENEELFIAGDFCDPFFLGAIIIKLDRKMMFDIIRGNVEAGNEDYFIYNSVVEMFPLSDSFEEADSIVNTINNKEYYDVDAKAGPKENNIYICHSNLTGINYGIVIEWNNYRLSVYQILLNFLPFILAYSVFTAIYSIWLSGRIYEPINRLMEITFRKNNEKDELDDIRNKHYRSELEYLEHTFRDTWVENIQNRELIANISNDVLEQLFRSIVIGKSVDSTYITDTMRGLGLETYIQGRYQVIAGRIRIDDDRELTSMEMSMYRRSLIGFMTDQKNENAIIINFFMDTSVFAVVLGFHEILSVIQIREITEQLIEKLMDFVSKLPYSLILGCGKVCNDMESIRFSYQDAYSQVEYLSYVSEDDGSSTKLEEQKDYNRKYFKERAEKIAEAADHDPENVVEEMINAILQEIGEFPEEKMVSYAELLEETLVEKMIAVHVEPGEINTLHSRIDNVLSKREEEGWKDLMLGVLMASVHLIHSSSRRSRYRYVDLAKEYISTHYSDGSLSLNEVSEAVGISAPYLSGIFSEAEQMGFSAYLNNYRVEQAKQFLEQTTMNMTDIGYKCGFNSAQSFNRVFKKLTGNTPGQYREYIGKNNAKKAGE